MNVAKRKIGGRFQILTNIAIPQKQPTKTIITPISDAISPIRNRPQDKRTQNTQTTTQARGSLKAENIKTQLSFEAANKHTTSCLKQPTNTVVCFNKKREHIKCLSKRQSTFSLNRSTKGTPKQRRTQTIQKDEPAKQQNTKKTKQSNEQAINNKTARGQQNKPKTKHTT